MRSRSASSILDYYDISVVSFGQSIGHIFLERRNRTNDSGPDSSAKMKVHSTE